MIEHYKDALENAGAKVLAFDSFGSYQGDWWAKVEYEGKLGWVNGSYGSCSGCDPFQAEFGYSTEHSHEDNEYHNPLYEGFDMNCERCKQVYDSYIAFGKTYLEEMMSQEEAEKLVSRNIDWDDVGDEIKFIKDNHI